MNDSGLSTSAASRRMGCQDYGDHQSPISQPSFKMGRLTDLLVNLTPENQELASDKDEGNSWQPPGFRGLLVWAVLCPVWVDSHSNTPVKVPGIFLSAKENPSATQDLSSRSHLANMLQKLGVQWQFTLIQLGTTPLPTLMKAWSTWAPNLHPPGALLFIWHVWSLCLGLSSPPWGGEKEEILAHPLKPQGEEECLPPPPSQRDAPVWCALKLFPGGGEAPSITDISFEMREMQLGIGHPMCRHVQLNTSRSAGSSSKGAAGCPCGKQAPSSWVTRCLCLLGEQPRLSLLLHSSGQVHFFLPRKRGYTCTTK